jgi:CNT family concentrative nucleoside transporter
MVAAAFGLSVDRKAIKWRIVAWGTGLQWALALVLLRVPAGRFGLEWLSNRVQGVLDHAFVGSSFVFGELGAKDGGMTGLGVVFAFQVLPTIIFVASLFAILYHFGIMQLIVGGLAKLMTATMGTSGTESLAVAASIFMGQTESPLTIRPFLARLTESELFAVMVSGMASVSGAILGAYVLVGKVPMATLLVAVAMTAPVSLMMAKIMVPEKGEPGSAAGEDSAQADDDKAANVLEAASKGASDGLLLALNVAAMLIAFLALVSLLNAIVGLVPVFGAPLSLERILGWLFAPIAVLMGVRWEDAQSVGTVLGARTILNELIAFERLRGLAGLDERSRAIATIAVTGFANLSSIGIQIGGLGALAPTRKGDISRLGVRALVCATLSNFSSACVFGVLA